MINSGEKLNILIVDDEAFIRMALCRLLNGHQVYEAADYSQAADILNSTEIDVVVTDNSFLADSGVEVLRLASTLRPRARRIMLSGTPPRQLKQWMEEGLIQHFFPKLGHESLKRLLGVIAGQ